MLQLSIEQLSALAALASSALQMQATAAGLPQIQQYLREQQELAAAAAAAASSPQPEPQLPEPQPEKPPLPEATKSPEEAKPS